MDNQSSTERTQSRKGPLVGEQEFVLIFISFSNRVLNTKFSADLSNLITLFVGPSKRLDWFNETVRHAKNIDIVNGVRACGFGTVLCGDGEPLDRSQGTKYEVVFRINKMEYGFRIGYVFGSVQNFNFSGSLGFGSNKKNSVGIRIWKNTFHLDARDNFNVSQRIHR